MTIEPATDDRPPAGTDPDRTDTASPGGGWRAAVRIGIRLALLAGLTVFAYHDTFQVIGVEIAEGSLIVYLPAAAALCLIAAIGVSLRDRYEPPIYDRQIDVIVGIVGLLLALSFKGLLNRRYTPAYLVTHIDLLSMLLFLFSGCVLLFGLRPALRYRWVWLLSLSLFPLPYRILVVALGYSRVAAGAAMLVLGVAASAVAVGNTRRRAVIGAMMSATLGTVLLVLLAWAAPNARLELYQWVPAIGCALATGIYMYIDRRRAAGSLRAFPHRRLKPPTAPRVARGATVLVVAAVGLFLIEVPQTARDAGTTVDGLQTRPPLIVPPGWHQVEATDVLSSRPNGRDAVRMRQILAQDTGEARFDVHSRPRRVIVDTVQTRFPLTLDIYLPTARYRLSGVRASEEFTVRLPHGVEGVLQTLVDDREILTYNRLVWRWNNGVQTQEVTLFAVDNHEPDAPFPQLRRPQHSWEVVNGMLVLLFRGNAVTEDLNPEFKDRDLLVELAGALIDRQVAAIGPADG